MVGNWIEKIFIYFDSRVLGFVPGSFCRISTSIASSSLAFISAIAFASNFSSSLFPSTSFSSLTALSPLRGAEVDHSFPCFSLSSLSSRAVHCLELNDWDRT